MTDEDDAPRPRSRLKIIVGVLVLLLALVILLLPTLVSLGIGQGLIRSAIASNVNGDVAFNSLSAGWFSAQKIDGLRITDTAGKEVAHVSVTVNNGLLSLALGRARPMNITVSGSIAGQVREDGSLSFADLVKPPPPPTPRMHPLPPKPKRPLRADDLPSIVVDVAGLNLTLESLKHKQTLAIDNLTGKAECVDPAQPITLKLAGKTRTGASGGTNTPGSIDISGKIDGLFAQNGSITLRGAAATLDVTATGDVPFPMLDRPATVKALTLKVASDDLTERIVIDAEARGKVDGVAGDSAIKVNAAISNAIDEYGNPSLAAATAHVNADATNLPLRAGDIAGEVRSFTASIVSDDLTQKLDIAAQAAGVFEPLGAPSATPAPAAGNPVPNTSTLTANLSIAKPFTSAGAVTFALENIAGSLEGRGVPTSLANAALKGSPIVPARDLGPMVDIEADFPGGVGAGKDLRAFVHAAKADAEIVAQMLDDRSFVGSRLLLRARQVDPALLANLTRGSLTSDRPLNVDVELSSFRLPAADEKTRVLPLGQLAARGSMKVAGPATLALASATTASGHATQPATATSRPTIAFDSIDLNIDSPALSNYLEVNGNILAGGGTVRIDERISGMFNSAGELALAGARPEGTIELENIAAESVLAFVPAEHADLARELLRGPMSGDISTSPGDDALHAAVRLHNEALTLNTNALRRNDGSITLDSTHAEAAVSPTLLALLQKDAPQPVVLRGTARVTADLEPFTLPAPGSTEPLFASPLRSRVRVQDAVIERKPTLAEALSIPSLDLALTIADSASGGSTSKTTRTITIADGRGSLRRADGNREIAALEFDGSITQSDAGTTPNLHVRVNNLSTQQAEALLGQMPGAISAWTGDSGSLEAQIESDGPKAIRARLTPTLPNVQGVFIATLRDDMVTLTAETSRVTLAKDALQARLNPAPATSPTESGPPRLPFGQAAAQPSQTPAIVVESNVPVELKITRCEFPLAMLDGKFDSAKVNVDVRLTGGPLKFAQPDGVKSSLDDLDVTLNVADLSKGAHFALRGKAEAIIPPPPPAPPAPPAPAPPSRDGQPSAQSGAQPNAQTAEERRAARREERRQNRAESQPAEPSPAASQPHSSTPSHLAGVVDVTGSLGNLVSSEGALDLTNSRLQMTAKVDEAPTAIADALADMQGLLVAAVGPVMNATFVADDFSRNTGTLDAKIDTTNGRLEGLLRGRESSFRINKNAPVKAELDITLPLRERLLMKIHPILADVRTTEQPLRVEIPTALAAIPADVSKLRAEVNITIGKVEFDAGSTTMQIFNLLGREGGAVIPGEIEPIRAQIRNGIVTYDKFTVHIGKYMLNYSGQVDLVNDTVDLRTEIPLSALKHDIPDLRDFADTIVVPLVTRGKFGALKTSIDPDFDLGKAALNAGFKGTLGEFFKGADGLFKDLFDKPKKP